MKTVSVSIRAMFCDHWISGRETSSSVATPSWKEVEQAIRRLDGISRKMVLLNRDEHTYFGVGGRWSHEFVVIGTRNQRDFLALFNPKTVRNGLLPIPRRKPATDARKLVPLDWALQAAKTFYRTGEFDESLPWETDV